MYVYICVCICWYIMHLWWVCMCLYIWIFSSFTFFLSQKAELRCLLPRSLLDNGFFPGGTRQKQSSHKCTVDRVSNYSWCGQRKMPSYVSKLVFPEDFLTALRTIAMQEDELYQVSSLLQEVCLLFSSVFGCIQLCFSYFLFLKYFSILRTFWIP